MALARRRLRTKFRTFRSSRAIKSCDEMSALAVLRAKFSRCRCRCRYARPTRCFALPQLADWHWGKGVAGAGAVGEGDGRADAARSLGDWCCRARCRAAWLVLGCFPFLWETLRRERRRWERLSRASA